MLYLKYRQHVNVISSVIKEIAVSALVRSGYLLTNSKVAADSLGFPKRVW